MARSDGPGGSLFVAGGRYRLRRVEEIPGWLRNNDFIRGGYRVGYPLRRCLRSLFELHNETGNIWSHLLGAVLFVGLFAVAYGGAAAWPLADVVVFFGVFGASCLVCLLGSATYHLCNCSSARAYHETSKLDYCGISALVTASFIPPLYYAFKCQPTLQAVYCGSLAAFAAVALAAPFVPGFLSDERYWLRIGLYVVTIASGVFPAVHAVLLFPVNAVTAPVFTGLAWMFAFYGVGVTFYAARWPERWFPGRFDTWGNSHQIWHCFVVAGAAVHFFTCLGLNQRYAGTSCDVLH